MTTPRSEVSLHTLQVRRNTALLVMAQIGLWAALAAFAAFGPGTVDELTASDTAVGGGAGLL